MKIALQDQGIRAKECNTKCKPKDPSEVTNMPETLSATERGRLRLLPGGRCLLSIRRLSSRRSAGGAAEVRYGIRATKRFMAPTASATPHPPALRIKPGGLG